MKRISPTVLGILVVVGGVCAALPFQRSGGRRVTVEPGLHSEAIEWRSNDFTLEVTARDQPLTDASVGGHSQSPAFGHTDRTTVHTLASLDDLTQPPALAGSYEPAAAISSQPAGSPAEGGGTSGRPRDSRTLSALPQSLALTHKIVDGDTLEALAEKHLGSRSRWTEIYNANPEVLDNPDVLPLGATIVILPGIRPSTSTSFTETDGLVPVLDSDLLKFRTANE